MKFLKVQFAITLIIFLVNDFSIGQTNTFPPTGNVGIGTTNPLDKLQVHGTTSLGVGIANSHFPWRENGWAYVSGKGIIFREDKAGSYLERMRIADNGNVGIGTTNPNATLDVNGITHTGSLEITERRLNVLNCVLAGKNYYNAGAIITFGPNGELNTGITSQENPNIGEIAVFDADGNFGAYIGFHDEVVRGRVGVIYNEEEKAIMAVDRDGKGFIEADVKNLRVPNPQQPNTDIVYACIEGPEAAAYVRGTARLVNGKSVVTLPEHFTGVSDGKEMTVQVTPLSDKSLGLAVVEKLPTSFVVKELHSGTGSYKFDWEVKSIRKDYEKYKIIRPSRKRIQRKDLTKQLYKLHE